MLHQQVTRHSSIHFVDLATTIPYTFLSIIAIIILIYQRVGWVTRISRSIYLEPKWFYNDKFQQLGGGLCWNVVGLLDKWGCGHISICATFMYLSLHPLDIPGKLTLILRHNKTVFSPGPLSRVAPYAFHTNFPLMYYPKRLMWSQTPPKPRPPALPQS